MFDNADFFTECLVGGVICANIMECIKCKGEFRMFRVKQTEEMANKTFRLPKNLLNELTKIAERENVSVNNLVRQCCEYALHSMKEEK